MTQKFKTTINCGNCKAKVSPFLNSQSGIDSWEVDLDNPDKVLTVNGTIDAATVTATLAKAGFKAQII